MTRFKKMMVGITVAATAAVGLSAGPLSAQQNYYYIYEITYYSSAGTSEEVGFEIQHCNRPADQFGQQTSYYTRTRSGICYYDGSGYEY